MYYNQPGYGQQGQMPPNYGQPPAYGYQQPPPGQTIIIQNNADPTITNMMTIGKISECEMCRRETDNVMKTKIGGVTLAWCCCLFLTTGIFFWIPCCMDSCKDTEVVCQSCHLIKTTIPANCC